jgi:hypothetical protein
MELNVGLDASLDNKPNAWGYNWTTLFLGDNKYGDLAFQVGVVPNLRQ